MKSTRRQLQNARREANYDPNPPRCQTCRNYGHDAEKHVMWCSWFGFRPANSIGVCDQWRGRDGSTLDLPTTTGENL